MSRPRKPSNILDARGAFKKNPNRARPNEPEASAPFPKEAPEHMTNLQQQCWREIVDIVPAGVLMNSDALVVEIAAVLLAEFRLDSGYMETSRIARLTCEIGKLGLSPSDRAKLIVVKPPKNEFDDV